MELTPRVGVESGLEYTYLHPTVLSEAVQMDQRLHFVGIPVREDARLWSRSGLDLYAGLAAKGDDYVILHFDNVLCKCSFGDYLIDGYLNCPVMDSLEEEE